MGTQIPLLDDAAVSRFLLHGYISFRPADVPDSTHDALFRAASALNKEARGLPNTHLSHFGDNLLARIPELRSVLETPSVQGALQSLLGPGFVLHPHHFVHKTGPNDQGWHQDGNLPWNSRGNVRSHRPVAVMLMYYPQDVTEEMGPTEVIPGTQYYLNSYESADGEVHDDDRLDRTFDASMQSNPDLAERDRKLAKALEKFPYAVERRRLVVPAGTIVIVHHDIVHRGTRMAPGCDKERYMYKMTYIRTQDPHDGPSWNAGVPFSKLDTAGVRPDLALTAGRIWNWLHGQTSETLTDEQLSALANQLTSADEHIRQTAGHELSWCGENAVPVLLAALDNASPSVRRMACFALGETRTGNTSAQTALVRLLSNDQDELVRSNAAFALGTLARGRVLHSSSVDALLGRLDPVKEPNNVFNAAVPRSTVRQSIATALLQAAANGLIGPEHAGNLAGAGLVDSDRYVRGLTVAALETMAGTLPEWAARLIKILRMERFSPAPVANAASGDNLWSTRAAKL